MSTLIGLTGGIGSGKSVVSRILRVRGYHVYDCDLEARRLMDESEHVCRSLKDRWGEDIYDGRGCLDRRRVASIVFNDDDERHWLDALVHSLVRQDVRRWMEAHADAAGPLFVESAILCTSGLSAMCTEIWSVTAPLEVRLKRLEMRSGLSKVEAMSRINAQQREADMLTESGIAKEILNADTSRLLPQLDALLNI